MQTEARLPEHVQLLIKLSSFWEDFKAFFFLEIGKLFRGQTS